MCAKRAKFFFTINGTLSRLVVKRFYDENNILGKFLQEYQIDK